MIPFSPCYIFESELNQYGLPTPDVQCDIMNLVQMASTLLDGECGRIDGDGNGSLVYTTYTMRILLQTRNRNLIMLPLKPVVPLTQSVIDTLVASGNAASGGNSPNCFNTGGLLPNTFNNPAGTLSGIVGASGRYGYTRQDMSIAYPDLFAFINPLNLVTMFGGPAPWVPIDVTNTDYDPKTGEVWIPAGLQLQRYSEVLMQFNTGFDPRNMPNMIKFVTAALVKNALSKGDGTTALVTLSMGRAGPNATFERGGLIDPTLDRMIQAYRTVRAY